MFVFVKKMIDGVWDIKGFTGGFLVPRDVALAMLLLVLTLMVSGTYLLSIRFP